MVVRDEGALLLCAEVGYEFFSSVTLPTVLMPTGSKGILRSMYICIYIYVYISRFTTEHGALSYFYRYSFYRYNSPPLKNKTSLVAHGGGHSKHAALLSSRSLKKLFHILLPGCPPPRTHGLYQRG